MIHPDEALFEDGIALPDIPACDHYAGNEKMVRKALEIQAQKGPLFDVTMDLEDGAAHGDAGGLLDCFVGLLLDGELNRFNRAGIRIHHLSSPHWPHQVRTILERAGEKVAYLTIPKIGSGVDAQAMVERIRAIRAELSLTRPIPLHFLIETHGAVRDAAAIAAIPEVESIDFGLMDYLSAHLGAIPVAALESPGQFDHPLLHYARLQIATAALSNGKIAAQNVTVDLKNFERTREDARRARSEFGFLRMWSIHPVQIDAVIEGMALPDHDIRLAIDILLKAQANSWGPVEHQGRLHDRASFRIMWTLVKQSRRLPGKLPPEILERWFAPELHA